MSAVVAAVKSAQNVHLSRASKARAQAEIEVDVTEFPTIEHDLNVIASRGEPLDPVLWQGRQWSVTTYGIEARDGRYTIEANRLAETRQGSGAPDWLAHMGGKTWVDREDFVTAFLVALSLHRSAEFTLDQIEHGLRLMNKASG